MATKNYEVNSVSYGACGSCELREWCPIFIVAVRSRAKDLIKETKTIDEAIAKAIVKRDKTENYADGGVVHFLESLKNKNKVILAEPQEGIDFLRDKMFNVPNIMSIQQLIMEEETRIE